MCAINGRVTPASAAGMHRAVVHAGLKRFFLIFVKKLQFTLVTNVLHRDALLGVSCIFIFWGKVKDQTSAEDTITNSHT